MEKAEKIEFSKFAVNGLLEEMKTALKEMEIAVLAEVHRFGGPIRAAHIVQEVKKNKKVLAAERACRSDKSKLEGNIRDTIEECFPHWLSLEHGKWSITPEGVAHLRIMRAERKRKI